VHELFLQLTSLTQTPKLCCLLQSRSAARAIIAKLDREAQTLAPATGAIIAK